MSRAKKHVVKYPLASKLTTGPQIPVEQAVQRAEALVEDMHVDLLAAVDAEIANVQRQAGRTEPDLKGLYESADRLMAIASACHLSALSNAALGLCDLLDHLRLARRWDEPGVSVHVATLRALRHEVSPASSKVVLEGLARVRAKLASVSQQPPAPEA
ncbi:hypothetical protein [Phenylobacterium sp.]|uniref:hypothetical protein n=1 Tax=Phenylobacterium sp. TaxID=1871053 RepID=UPI002606BB7A|nr:hypothetical protein [Phenylobacterium sp.]